MLQKLKSRGAFPLRAAAAVVLIGLPASLSAATIAVAKPSVRAAASTGTTYSGVAADGATVEFTVAANGQTVESYSITNVTGRQTGGGTCSFVGDGAAGVWAGVAIEHRTFAYALGDALTFRGTLLGASLLYGVFSFYVPAAGQTPACSTGRVHFTVRAGT